MSQPKLITDSAKLAVASFTVQNATVKKITKGVSWTDTIFSIARGAKKIFTNRDSFFGVGGDIIAAPIKIVSGGIGIICGAVTINGAQKGVIDSKEAAFGSIKLLKGVVIFGASICWFFSELAKLLKKITFLSEFAGSISEYVFLGLSAFTFVRASMRLGVSVVPFKEALENFKNVQGINKNNQNLTDQQKTEVFNFFKNYFFSGKDFADPKVFYCGIKKLQSVCGGECQTLLKDCKDLIEKFQSIVSKCTTSEFTQFSQSLSGKTDVAKARMIADFLMQKVASLQSQDGEAALKAWHTNLAGQDDTFDAKGIFSLAEKLHGKNIEQHLLDKACEGNHELIVRKTLKIVTTVALIVIGILMFIFAPAFGTALWIALTIASFAFSFLIPNLASLIIQVQKSRCKRT